MQTSNEKNQTGESPEENTGVSPQVEAEIIDYFVSFVQMLGLPKSVGQIYGTLFASTEPLVMDDIVERLGISKGSASQGLSLLRSLGAVQSEMIPGDRREHFSADLNVSRIVHHFFEERLLPRLQNGAERVDSILSELDPEGDESQQVLVDRVKALRKWQKRGNAIVPRVVKWLRR
ncbi:MAG: transcriptional regulator [Verrucomicrobiota bacterium]